MSGRGADAEAPPTVETGPFWSVGSKKLPRLVGEHRADACVVGLGGSGLTAALRLVEAGLRVVALDQIGVGAGAAGRNGGFLLAGPAEFHHRLRDRVGRDRARALYELTLETRDRMMSDTPGADPRGSLRTGASEEEEEDIVRHGHALVEDGFSAELLAPDGRLEGLLVPGDGVFDPGLRCRALAERLADRAALYVGAVHTVEPERVETESARVRAEIVLVAVDGRLETILPVLSDEVRSVRLQMLATEPAEDVRVPHAVYHRFGFDYWQQRPDGRVLLGGARDQGKDAEETSELGTTKTVQTALETLLRKRVGTKAKVTHRWSGIAGYTRDHLPIADEVGGAYAGVFACGGYSGQGNVLGVLAGQSMADLALGRRTPPFVEWLRAARPSDR